MCDTIVEAVLTAKSGNIETTVKQMRRAAHMALACGTTATGALNKMAQLKQVIALFEMRCVAKMQPENLTCACNYIASPKSTLLGFQKWVKELRAWEFWWYHLGHPHMLVECIQTSRRMPLPCKPVDFCCDAMWSVSASTGQWGNGAL